MITIALREMKSTQNVGLIVRSLVAFGGCNLQFIGLDLPWRFKKGTQAFSRKLESKCKVEYFATDSDFFQWCEQAKMTPIALEIIRSSVFIDEFIFPKKSLLVIGNEASGLACDFMRECKHVVTIPQYGQVGSLNAGVAASIAMYEYARQHGTRSQVGENEKYLGEILK